MVGEREKETHSNVIFLGSNMVFISFLEGSFKAQS